MVVHHCECMNAPELYNGKVYVICILPQLKKRIRRKKWQIGHCMDCEQDTCFSLRAEAGRWSSALSDVSCIGS